MKGTFKFWEKPWGRGLESQAFGLEYFRIWCSTDEGRINDFVGAHHPVFVE